MEKLTTPEEWYDYWLTKSEVHGITETVALAQNEVIDFFVENAKRVFIVDGIAGDVEIKVDTDFMLSFKNKIE